MGLTRTSEGWPTCYRYLLSPLQGQIPFSAFPVNDVIPSAESCRPDPSPSYPEFQTLCPATFSTPYGNSGNQGYHHLPLDAHAGSEVGNVQALQPCSVPPYLPPFTDVNSIYSYNLENYGSTNVGAAVAMSLASLSSGREIDPPQHLVAQHHSVAGMGMVAADDEMVCPSLHPSQTVVEQGQPGVGSEGGSQIQPGPAVDTQQLHSEYLLSELLSGDSDLLGMCSASNAYKNTLNSSKIYSNSTTEVGLAEPTYSTSGMPVKELDNSIQKEDTNLTDHTQLDLNNLYMNLTEERGNDQSTCGQKKYQRYGKWRPISMEEKTSAPCEGFQTQDVSGFLMQTSAAQDDRYYHVSNNVYDRMQPTELEHSESSCSSLGDRVADNFSAQTYSRDQFPSTSFIMTDDDEDSKDIDKVSKDEKRARDLKLPLSNAEIILLAIDEFNERISKFELTDAQLSLIRDIRRRGKNKVAAQNCRKRKLDQISGLQKEVEVMHMEKGHLQYEQDQIMTNLQFLKDRYYRLCQVVSQATNRRELSPDLQQLLVQQ